MRVVLLILFASVAAPSAVFTTKLQSKTVAAWEKYVERAERQIAAGRPLLEVSDDTPNLVDLNPNGDNDGQDVRNGYIHHWIGAVRIPNASVPSVRAVLEDYELYPRIYASDVKLASASRIEDSAAAGRIYDVRLVSERVEGIGLHFAFEIRSRVSFRMAGEDSLVESRSYSIRESDSGRAPYSDLRPEGDDHGILWRLNSYWRLRQAGASVYAECEVISLSRKPLLGTGNLVKSRAHDSLEATLLQTRNRAFGR